MRDIVSDDVRATQATVDTVTDLVIRLGLPTHLCEGGGEASVIPAIVAAWGSSGADQGVATHDVLTYPSGRRQRSSFSRHNAINRPGSGQNAR